ncbi:hypothetical protein REPUB_Repub08aG0058000 [Reevesia pubescens]
MESGNVSGTDNGSDLKTHQTATPSENSHVSPDKMQRLSSSSSLSVEAIQSDSTGTRTSNADVGTPLKGENTEEDITVSGRSSDGLIPPTQAMDTASGGSPSDRIPPYIFARTNTTGQAEWSVASNESLFSIHMGNTSFSKEQLNWMYKSGELGYIDSTHSGTLIDLPGSQTPTRKSNEITKKSADNLNGGQFGVNEAAAAETMREVLREKESQHKDNIAKESAPHSRSLSQHSDASVKSFAFPILTGDADYKTGSFRKSTKNKKQSSTRPSAIPKETPQIPPEAPKPQTPPETPKQDKSETPKATRNAGPKRWFSCFSCCSS